MNELFFKALSFDDSELERLEAEEKVLLEKLGAHKLHPLDNVALDKAGDLYALEDIKQGGEIVKNGLLFLRSKKEVKRGNLIEI
ncbi:MAG: hypothetical protein IJD67_02100 [Clostridia bacterium]|nr:hypothetical protein [Clostridia bacterium]